MNFLRLLLIAFCAVTLVACKTYGDPDLSKGYFDWAPQKSDREVFQPRRAALGHEQQIGSELRTENARLAKRLASLNKQYDQRKREGADESELSAIRREISSLKQQIEVLAAQ